MKIGYPKSTLPQTQTPLFFHSSLSQKQLFFQSSDQQSHLRFLSEHNDELVGHQILDCTYLLESSQPLELPIRESHQGLQGASEVLQAGE